MKYYLLATAVLSLITVKLFAQVPTISSINPINAPAGTVLTINGSNFNPTAANNVVAFGGIRTVVTTATATKLTVTMPLGTTNDGQVSVLNKATTLTGYSRLPYLPTFPASENFATGVLYGSTGPWDSPQSVSIKKIIDFDGDGKPDVLTTYNQNKEFLIYRNKTVGNTITSTSFGPFISFPTVFPAITSSIRDLDAADLDGDGKPDIVALNSNTLDIVSVMRNVSSVGSISQGSFAEHQDLVIQGAGQALFISLKDMDADGKPDIVILTPTQFLVARNISSGGNIAFADHIKIEHPQYGNWIKIADLDRDGKPDIALATSTGLLVYRNQSTPGSITTGLLSAPATLATTNQGNILDVKDFDGDGKLDIYTALYGKFMIYRNNATAGSLTAASFYPPVSFTTIGGTTALPNDIDGDGKIDITLGEKNKLVYRVNTSTPGNISFGPEQRIMVGTTQTYYGPKLVCDLDADGKPDLINDNFMVYKSDAYVRPIIPTITSYSPKSAPVGTTITINGADFGSSPANNVVFFGSVRGTVTSATATKLKVVVPVGAAYRPIYVLNTTSGLSGFSAVAFRTTFPNGKAKLKATDFEPKVQVIRNTYGNTLGFGDVNGNGKLDMILDDGVYPNTSTPGSITANSFGPRINTQISVDAAVAFQDVTGDGKPDVFAGNDAFKNTSRAVINDQWFERSSVFSSNRPYYTFADFNLDGRPDVFANALIVNKSTSEILKFSAENYGSVSGIMSGVGGGDLNGDGKPDIFTQFTTSTGEIKFPVITGHLGVRLSTSVNGYLEYKDAVSIVTTPGYPLFGTAFVTDFNNDDKPDLFYTNDGITILANSSTVDSISFNGGYAYGIARGPGQGPNSFTFDIGDLNGDGFPDIVIGLATGGVQVLINTTKTEGGAISFASPVTFALTDANPRVAIADIDGDGIQDIAVAVKNKTTFFRNKSQTNPLTDAPIVNSFSPASGKVGITVTITGNNFNATPENNIVYFGATKAVVASCTNSQIRVKVPAGASYKPISVLNTASKLTGYSSLAFNTTYPATINGTNPKVDFATAGMPYAVAASDIDGDGKVDVLTANAASNSFSVLRNTSTSGVINSSSLAARVNFTTGSQPASIAVEDINGDGLPDVITGNYGGSSISVFRNTSTSGNISFAPKVDLATDVNPFMITIGDIDSDGRPDIAVVALNNKLSLIRNVSVGGVINAAAFESKVAFPSVGAYYHTGAVLADINNNGLVDLMTIHNSGGFRGFNNRDGFNNFVNESAGNVFEKTATGAAPRAIAAGDFNDDGLMDIMVANKGANTITFSQNITNPPSEIFVFPEYLTKPFPVEGGPSALAIGNITGDGKPDVLVASPDGNSITTYRNNYVPGQDNATILTDKLTYATGQTPNSVAIADIDGDGKNDLIAVNTGSNTLSIIRNNATSGAATAMLAQTKQLQNGVDAEVNVVVYPNPTTQDVGFALENYSGRQVAVTLTNLYGKVIATKTLNVTPGSSLVKLNLASKPATGMYVLKVTGEGLNVSKKVLVE